MIKPYPLQFQAEFKHTVWGGHALQKFYDNLPEGLIGESWMISDHPSCMSKVSNGPLRGMRFDEIRTKYGRAWLGPKGIHKKTNRLPLLIKLLSCEDDLSIQVHPTDDYVHLPPDELGKTEMWYVLDAKPDAHVVYGLKKEITHRCMERALSQGTVLDKVQRVPVQPGDTLFIPAGTVHALCAGVIVLEIQQNSDTTYRLYDYDRPDLAGNLRKLHITDALNVISYENTSIIKKEGLCYAKTHKWTTLVRCPLFIVEKATVSGAWSLHTESHCFTIVFICTGNGKLCWENNDNEFISLFPGQCCLLPANLGSYRLEGNLSLLRSYLP